MLNLIDPLALTCNVPLAAISPWLLPSTQILVGFVVLILGGELLVRGASGFAVALHIPPLIIGLTIVAFCTSAPELAVSLQAATQGKPEMAVGNVVGSCLCNILLVLGLSAVIAPMIVSGKLVRREVPFLIAITALVCLFAIDGQILRWQGGVMFLLLIGYIIWSIAQARKEKREIQEELAAANELPNKVGGKQILICVGLMLAGLVSLLLASDWLVKGGVEIAEILGVSELMIGLTVLALGTSLPELAISVIAALRGQQNLAVGNVIGSNIFNLLCVMGLTAAVSPIGLPVTEKAIHFDMPIMLGVTLICLPIFLSGCKIGRWEGLLLLAYYFAYLATEILCATKPELGQQVRFYVFFVGGPIAICVCFIPAITAIIRSRKEPGV